MIPKIGFVFPDGTVLDTGVEGHCKCAYRYIRKKSLALKEDFVKKFEESAVDGEDIFLIVFFGAAKIGATKGNRYIWLPQNPRDEVKKVAEECEKAGFQVVYIRRSVLNNIAVETYDLSRMPYNQTVIVGRDKKYIYNPRRDGD